MESKLPAAAIRRAVGRSIADTLALEVLTEDASHWTCLRDSLLWNIIECQHETASPYQDWLVTATSSQSPLSQVLDGLLACPLTQVGSPVDHLRGLVRQRLYLLLSREMEQVLLQELLTATSPNGDSNNNNHSTPVAGHSKTKKNNKKKRVKRKKNRVQLSSKDAKPTLPQVNERDDDMNEESSSEENGPSPSSASSIAIAFPDNGTSMRDRNRNTVLILSILEDVMYAVHVEVGLEVIESDTGSQHSSTGDQSEKNKERATPDHEQISEVEVEVEPQRSLTHGNTDGPGPVRQPGDDSDAVFQAIDTVDTLSYQPAMDDTPLNTNRTSLDMFSGHYGTHGGGFFHRSEPFDFTWGLTDAAMDDWGRVQGFASRDRSILTEFFPSGSNHERVDDIIAEQVMASSTAASIASSSEEENDDDDDADTETDDKEVDTAFDMVEPLSPVAALHDLTRKEVPIIEDLVSQERIPSIEESASPPKVGLVRPITHSPEPERHPFDEESDNLFSPLPKAPSTPSPKLSPILVSLADLKELQQDSLERIKPPLSLKLPSARSLPAVQGASLPNSPHEMAKPKMRASRSRENLHSESGVDGRETGKTGSVVSRSISEAGRGLLLSLRSVLPNTVKSTDDHDVNGKATVRRSIDALAPYRSPVHRHSKSKSRDDTDIKHVRVSASRSIDATAPNRNAAAKVSVKSISSAKPAGSSSPTKPFSHLHFDSAASKRTRVDGDICARSEISMTGTDEYQPLQDGRHRHAYEDVENNTATKDGETTTITSALSHRETDDVVALRESLRDYRDMCLTLGAEVAKLKNMLACQRGTALYPDLNYAQGVSQTPPDPLAFDPQAVSRFFKYTPRARTLAAMSDAGLRGEHESQASEDDMQESGNRMVKPDTLGHTLSGATIAGSDVSWDHASSQVCHLPPPTRDLHDPVSLSGTHSRLAKDILKFLDSTNMQLRKQNTKREKAVERMTRLVNAVWPRAQVTLYGSHVTGLCIPSSDLDFVICLPAVHKNAPAVAPGALEGRNAVNESSQRLLARRLKGESWIDPRSMKLIERTAVPVIKVATKDTKARTLQLDITFDSPGHHGLEAVEMVTQTMAELPMLRPLVLVLKQFLLDRCLLAAYTGGLSSYCLFLMVARYLQEQPSSWGDCGSLLMGFLDFYGNCVSFFVVSRACAILRFDNRLTDTIVTLRSSTQDLRESA
jgi:hypothetical protein